MPLSAPSVRDGCTRRDASRGVFLRRLNTDDFASETEKHPQQIGDWGSFARCKTPSATASRDVSRKGNSLRTHRVPGHTPSPRGLKNTHPPRRGDCRIARRVLAFPVGEGGTRSVTDEGLQAAGTAWCEVLLCTIPHQSLTAEDVFRFRNAKSSVFSRRRKTPRDAARLVQLSPKGSLR